MNLTGLETPALILDAKKFQKNIKSMQEILAGKTLKLRPHYKSHKCAQIAHLQMQSGAKGMTCAKLSEAIDLADCGIEDILIANQITEPKKIRRLADLAGDCRLTVCVDDADNARALSKAAQAAGTTIHCYIEFEIGMERCGVTKPEEVLALAKLIEELPHLEYDGVQAYAGHISHVEDEALRLKMTKDNAKKIRDLLKLLSDNGLPAKELSGGSTGTAQMKAAEGMYTELQAGSYLFMDAVYKNCDLPFENALFVYSTVVSTRDDLTVVDAGVKTCGVDQGMPAILDNAAREIVASEEHFQLHGLEKPLQCGDKVWLVPGHCCSTVNLYDRIYVVSEGKVVDRIAITARGFGK